MGDKRINDIISFIVEHQPKQLHLIVSTRSDPSLPLARLRSQNQITEIRAADLSFNMVESAIFLNERLELELSPDEIELLKSKTEGWIAGLQLAALSVKGRSDKSDFIKSFTGDNRYVVDYLIEEVLNRQSKTIQNFLQNSCILDRLTGSLCNDLTEQTNSSEILQTLERANLFIFPLDNQRKWYRYHHLFSDLLRKRLKLMDLDRLFSLHKKACQWYLKHQMKDEAINHAIAAKDFEIAAKLIEDIAEIDWDRGQESQLLKWFRRLPEELISSSPHLSIFHARELFESAQPEEAEERLKNAEFLLQKETIPEKARKSIKGRIAVIRGVMASYRGDIPNIIKYIGQALELLSDEELMWKSVAATTLGFAYGWSGEGDMRKAHKAFSEAREISIKADNIYFNIFAGSCIAVVEVKQGNLKTAIQMHTHLLELSKERGMWQVGPVGSIFSALGNILCEKNEVKKGIENIKKGIELSTLGQDPLALTGCNFHLVRSLLFQKDYKGAQNVILKIDHTAQHFEMPPWMLSTLEALRVYTWLGLGKIKLVQDWINKRKLSIEDAIHQQREAEYVAFSHILIKIEQYEKAIYLIKKLLTNAISGNRVYVQIELLILNSLIQIKMGEIEIAQKELIKALNLAEPGGFIQIFISKGEEVINLLEIILKNKNPSAGLVPKAYIRKLVSAAKVGLDSKLGDGLIEKLSERELEVLNLISAGLSNFKIGDKLCISLNTVRTHTKNINMKLNVHSRTQAIAKAKDLELIK
jgi:LuxR family maltose regulon positive regulatory protein